ncbi:MAG: hypothetical protein QOG54_2702 [Actinomycetota bacterium]|nr:hypothetical protein [Actinomycetota bacterium]
MSRKIRLGSAAAVLLAGLFVSAPALAAKGTCFGSPVTIKGDSGNNTLRGTSGDDVIDGKGGNDTIDGKGGDDVICGGNGKDTLNGGGGFDFVLGGGDNDVVKGGKEDDVVMGLLGNDELIGGPGTGDAASFLFATGSINANLATGRATGEGSDTFQDVERVFGSDQDDVITGNEGFNALTGEGGDDQLFGGENNDILSGGLGNDTMDGQTGERDLAFYVFSATAISADLAGHSVTGEGNDTIPNVEGVAGSPNDDTILGGPTHDLISGGGGDDLIDGRGGFDVAVYALSPGPVNVNLAQGNSTGDGTDTFRDLEAVYGTPFDDTMVGSAEDNVFFGDYGNDRMAGGAGNDVFYPDLGDDEINGGIGPRDEIDFFLADGPVNVDMAAGTASGDGSDSFTEVEFISGSEFDDTITGGPNTDYMMGGGGNDTLIGGEGDDAMDGELGDDSVDGGPGSDICRNQETAVSCEGQGGPTVNAYRDASRSAGSFQRKRAH